jgi:hypothetical protein
MDAQFLQSLEKDDCNLECEPIGGEPMVTYDERLTGLIKDERFARAQRQGFVDAKSFPEWDIPVAWTSDLAEQHCYNSGFTEGRALLKREAESKIKGEQ